MGNSLQEKTNHDLRYHSNICISGLTASGKSTHSHLLAGEFGLTYVSGSQIQLNLRGVSPIQERHFWITPDARELWNLDEFRAIDSELLSVESRTKGAVFDTSTMPWRHRDPALCIWIGSDLRSRSIKSIISHRGKSDVDHGAYPDLITAKDASTQSLYSDLYGIDIGDDLSPFDLVLDISSFVSEPRFAQSWSSIEQAHAIIRAACGWHLTGRHEFRHVLDEAKEARPDVVLIENVGVAPIEE